MITICNSCGKTNPSASTHCRACGMALYEEIPADTPCPTPAPASTGTLPMIGTTINPAAQEAPSDLDTLKLNTTYYANSPGHQALVSVAFNFPRVLVAGFASVFYIELKNLAGQNLDQVEVNLESLGLAAPICERTQIEKNQTLRLLIPLEPVRAGGFVLQFTVKVTTEGQLKGYIGTRGLWINPPPGDPQRLELRSILTNRFAPDSSPDVGPQTLLLIPGGAAIRNFEELLKFKLPDQFTPLVLSYDYQVSLAAVEQSTTTQARHLIIYQLFLGYVQTGTLLKLTPLDPATGRTTHLVARSKFRIGRSRDPATPSDFITWFLPRNRLNDEKTKHLGRIHAVAECQGDSLFIRDNQSIGGSTFDGQFLPTMGGEPLNRRAVLALSAEYFLDVLPIPSAYPAGPDIKNIKLWKGPEIPPPDYRGAVRFTPINSDISHHDAVWLFTDATFGTSRSNAVVFNLPGLSEIQGRFHHYRGCFWLENCVSNEAVKINSRALNHNEIAPLISGLILQLGQVSFQVEIQG